MNRNRPIRSHSPSRVQAARPPDGVADRPEPEELQGGAERHRGGQGDDPARDQHGVHQSQEEGGDDGGARQ